MGIYADDVDFPDNIQGTCSVIVDDYMIVGICAASGRPVKMATFEVMTHQIRTHGMRKKESSAVCKMGIYDP